MELIPQTRTDVLTELIPQIDTGVCMPFKCTKCDKVFHDEDLGCETAGCEPKHWLRAATIHLLIQSETDECSGRGAPPKYTSSDDEPYDPAPVPLRICCKPESPSSPLSKYNATNTTAPVTCELCLQYIETKIAELELDKTEPENLPPPTDDLSP